MRRTIALFVVTAVLLAGCVSLPAEPPTTPPVAERLPDGEWQMTRRPGLSIYHVKPLADPAAWEQVWQKVTAWTGRTRQEPLVIWVFPDQKSMYTWLGLEPGFGDVGGFWDPGGDRLLLYDLPDRVKVLRLAAHEMAHALFPVTEPKWVGEGWGALTEERYTRLLGGKADPACCYGYGLTQLQRLAQQERLDPALSTWKADRFDNPWYVGLSVWLFVRHYHGDAGMKQLLDGEPGPVLEQLFGKPLPAVWDDWNAYLKGPDLLKDWAEF